MEQTFDADQVEVGFHPDGYRIDRTTSPVNWYTKSDSCEMCWRRLQFGYICAFADRATEAESTEPNLIEWLMTEVNAVQADLETRESIEEPVVADDLISRARAATAEGLRQKWCILVHTHVERKKGLTAFAGSCYVTTT